MTFITTRATAVALGIAKTSVVDLVQAELLPQPLRVGHQVLFDDEDVLRLAGWKDVSAPPPAYVVRVQPKSESADFGDGRRWAGFTAGLYEPGLTSTQNEQVRRDALRGWWPARNPAQYVGLPLVATLASFVVAVFQIEDGFDRAFGRVRFNVSPPSPEALDRFSGHRLRLPRGSISLRVGPES